MCTDFELLEVKVPLIFLGMVGFSPRREGRYELFDYQGLARDGNPSGGDPSLRLEIPITIWYFKSRKNKASARKEGSRKGDIVAKCKAIIYILISFIPPMYDNKLVYSL